MKLKLAFSLSLALFGFYSEAQTVKITVDAKQNQTKISPYIYGRNNSGSNVPSKPVSKEQWQLLRDAGVKIVRENEGNNLTKYNWRLKLSSHPDWYNNVEIHDWDYNAKEIQKNLPYMQQMWALPLLGYAAKNGSYNFDCFAYDSCKGKNQESNYCAQGDVSKYLMPWPADSAVGILNHWLKDLKINPKNIQYWNMDNEAEVWNAKHDDIITKPISPDDYIEKYVTMAKKAKAAFPDIKLVGPAFSNEWQWYNWNGVKVTAPDGAKFTWLEYFIKRISEEQKKSGVKLLDVLDFHLYPESDAALTLQMHRIWYDTTWSYSKSNGLKRLGPSDWNQSQEKEYVFKRCNDWLKQYMGENNGVTMGMSESGQIYKEDPNIVACWYASNLGVFGENNVELFTPWDWYTGMWEVMHLFTKYSGTVSVASNSTLNDVVSAYSSLSSKGDSLTVILVNKDQNNSQTVSIDLKNIAVKNGTASVYSLSGLPKTETFISATKNALKQSTANVSNNSVQVVVPKLSVTAIVIKADKPVALNVK